MALEHAFSFPARNGLHARPANVLRDAAARFRSKVTLLNTSTGARASLASVLALIGSGTQFGHACVLQVEGPDEAEALAHVRDVLQRLDDEDGFAAPRPSAQRGAPPRIIARCGCPFVSGTGASDGVGVGRCVRLGASALPEAVPPTGSDRATEWNRFTEARRALEGELTAAVAAGTATAERDILRAHLALLADPEFSVAVRRSLEQGGLSIGFALKNASESIGAMLAATRSEYLRARAADIHDLVARLIARIYHLPDVGQAAVALEPDSVLVAANLFPSQLLALNRCRLKGLVLGEAGATSHVVILARAFGIPCVTGFGAAITTLASGERLIVDGRRGVVVRNATSEVERYYRAEQAHFDARREALARDAARPAATSDGHRLGIAVNASTPEEVEEAIALAGAEGVGLFRTEMMFLDRSTPPDEDEQTAVLERVARAAGERPALVRLLDVGGDKPLAFLGLPREANPFLGWRGARIYPAHRELIGTQLRAVLRAAASGNLRILIPMVTTAEEIRWVRQAAAEAARALAARGVPHRWPIDIGIMVETPAAALALSRLADEADFFSLGTNDLSQYFFAAERGNGSVAGLLELRSPAFLSLLQTAVLQAHERGKWIGLCGEMGGDARNLPLLAGLGLDEISAAPTAIPTLKAKLGRWSLPQCQRALESALQARDAGEVETLLGASSDSAALPLVDEAMAAVEFDAAGKALAIQELAQRLERAGRTDDAAAVEEAIWKREDVYATSIGFGIAIPHCKTPHLKASALAMLRLREPIEWKPDAPAEDGSTRVSLVILLAVREAEHGDVHLRLFAQLARQLMHEDVRARLQGAADAAALVRELKAVLRL